MKKICAWNHLRLFFYVAAAALFSTLLAVSSLSSPLELEGAIQTANLNITKGTDIGTLEVGADGRYAVYMTENVTHDATIYRSAVFEEDGPHVVAENAIFVPPTHVSNYYLYTEIVGDLRKLYAISTSSGVSLPLSEEGVDVPKDSFGFYGERAQIAPNNRQIAYLGNDESIDQYSLFTAEIDGDAVTSIRKLPGIRFYPAAEYSYLKISPDSQQVMVYASPGPDNHQIQEEVFLAPLAGGEAKIIYQESEGSTWHENIRMTFTPDGQYAVIFAETGPDLAGKLMVIDLNSGNTLLSLSNSFSPVRSHRWDYIFDNHSERCCDRYLLTPDGSQIIFRIADVETGLSQFYMLPISGGAPTKIGPPSKFLHDVKPSPDSQHLIIDDGRSTYSTSLESGETVNLNSQLSNIERYKFTPDGSQLILVGEGDSQPLGLYRMPASGGTPELLLASDFQNEYGEVVYSPNHRDDIDISSDGNLVLFLDIHLYTLSLIDGSVSQVSGLQPPTNDQRFWYLRYLFSPTDTVLFETNYNIQGVYQTNTSLFSAIQNKKPVITSQLYPFIKIDIPFSHQLVASDPEGGGVVITAPVKPDWLTFVDNGDGTALLSGTATVADAGSHTLQIDVTDNIGLVRSKTYTLVVDESFFQTYLPQLFE
ncbi:MAG: putative Ig domain-containing protein [Chloroflexota bacterium]